MHSSGIIDCQSHLFVPEVLERLERRTEHPLVYRKGGDRWVQMGDWHRRVFANHTSADATVAAMDGNGIDLTALSINDPGPEWFGEDAPRVARICNDFIAGVARDHPRRFTGLCVLPMLHPMEALAELERCETELRMRGILVYTNIAGRYPDEPEFRPVFARAAERGLPVFLHPTKPLTIDAVKDYEMTSSLGNMFENTIALNRLILSGILDELPELKLVCPHLGGALPFIIGRIDHQVRVLKRGPVHLRRNPSDYLRQVWFDIVSPLPEAIRFACDLLGTERLIFASDYPWVQPEVILGALHRAKLSAGEERRILGENARRLLGI